MSQKIAAIVATVATVAVSAVREFTVASYRISNPSTPEFLAPFAPFTAPDSAAVLALSASKIDAEREKVILKVEGVIRRTYKGVQDLQDQGQKFLPITAEKYAHSSFSFSQDADGSIVITLPIFKKGPAVKVADLKKDAPSMVGLLSLSPTVATVAPETVATPEVTVPVTPTT